jgi:hypothetical protein
LKTTWGEEEEEEEEEAAALGAVTALGAAFAFAFATACLGALLPSAVPCLPHLQWLLQRHSLQVAHCLTKLMGAPDPFLAKVQRVLLWIKWHFLPFAVMVALLCSVTFEPKLDCKGVLFTKPRQGKGPVGSLCAAQLRTQVL